MGKQNNECCTDLKLMAVSNCILSQRHISHDNSLSVRAVT